MSTRGRYYKTIDFSIPDERNIHSSQIESSHTEMREEFTHCKGESVTETNMTWETLSYANSENPEVWGPAFWFVVHNGSARYPLKPSNIWKERMKGFIFGMPALIPCEKCADHATAHIEANRERMDEVVSSRENLFNFFVDFHNYVNERYGKRIVGYEEAMQIYTRKTNVKKLSYEKTTQHNEKCT
jgi:hypothetical protein